MIYLIYAYIALFTLVTLWELRDLVAPEQPAPRWRALLTTVGSALGIAGMLLFAQGVDDPRIAQIWQVVFGLLLLQMIFEAFLDFRRFLRRLFPDGGVPDEQSKALVWTFMGLALVASLPYFWMNYQVAFGSAG